MIANHFEENGAVLTKLALADAVHGGHFGRGRRLAPGHIDQGLVGENHVGRDPLLFGKLGAALAQRLEQRRVVRPAFGQRRSIGRRTGHLAGRGLERVFAQRDLVDAFEHPAAGFGDRPGRRDR